MLAFFIVIEKLVPKDWVGIVLVALGMLVVKNFDFDLTTISLA